jgi:hypothetical protein
MKGRRRDRPTADGLERGEDDALVRRLRALRWPAPPDGARERGWERIQEALRDGSGERPDEDV